MCLFERSAMQLGLMYMKIPNTVSNVALETQSCQAPIVEFREQKKKEAHEQLKMQRSWRLFLCLNPQNRAISGKF